MYVRLYIGLGIVIQIINLHPRLLRPRHLPHLHLLLHFQIHPLYKTDQDSKLESNNNAFKDDVKDNYNNDFENNIIDEKSNKSLDIDDNYNNIYKDSKKDSSDSLHIPLNWNQNTQPQASQSLTNTVMSLDSLAISESFEHIKIEPVEDKSPRTASKALTINIDSPLFSPIENLNKTFPSNKNYTPSNNNLSNQTENSMSPIEKSHE